MQLVRALPLLLAVSVTVSVVTRESWAKGPSTATVCGASGCATYRGELEILPMYQWWTKPFSLRSAPRPAAYYRIRLVDPGVQTSILLYSPARRAMRIWQGRSSIPGQGGPAGP
jgi:hypothetical protein